jgi:hypothetical protein
MAKYTVWHSDGKSDGDSTHDSLEAAQAEFDYQRSRRNVFDLDLSEVTEDGFVSILSWNAKDDRAE